MLVSILPLLALLPATLATAAPPNPDQLFALQEAAAEAASVSSPPPAPASTPVKETSPAGGEHDSAWSPLKRHQHGQKFHGGMEKKWIGKRGSGGVRLAKPEEVREKRGAHKRRSPDASIDSSQVKSAAVDDSDLEGRADEQYYYATSDNVDYNTYWSEAAASTDYAAASSSSWTPSATTSSAAATSTTVKSDALSHYWPGVSSYYLYAMADTERYQVLDAIADGGFKVVRIFIAYVGANNKVRHSSSCRVESSSHASSLVCRVPTATKSTMVSRLRIVRLPLQF